MAQVGVILDRHGDVRANGPDAVHATRVACRRLRSTLRTYRALWTPRYRGLLADLRWYGRLLGDPRDTEVLEEGLLDRLDQVSAPGAAQLANRLRARLDADRADGLSSLYRAMATQRFARFDQRVRRLSSGVGWLPLAYVPAERLLPSLASGPVVQVALLASRLPESGEERLVGLHELRKKAKAARYAWEAIGEPGLLEAALWKQVTESLGELQDAVVGAELIDELEAAAVAAGEPTEAYLGLRAVLAGQASSGERDGLDSLAKAIAEAP